LLIGSPWAPAPPRPWSLAPAGAAARGRYLPGTRPVLVAPLQQLNLKIPPAVLDHWRAQAVAEGLSVRDWLVSRVGPTAPAAGAELAERVAELERVTADLAAAVGQLRGAGAAPRSPLPEPEPVASIAGPEGLAPLPKRRLTPDEAAGLVTLPELAAALGLAGGSAVTNWIAREAAKRGGDPVGAIYRGHRLRGKGLLPGAQKPGWLFERVAA
jgi:hypothetical protein